MLVPGKGGGKTWPLSEKDEREKEGERKKK